MSLLYSFENIRTPFLTFIFRFWTMFGEELFVIFVICLLYWCVDKALAYKIGIAFFISGLLLQGLKITFRIERPWLIDQNFTPVKEAVKSATGYSFPSGHAQCSATLFTSLAISLKHWYAKVICILIFLMVSVSRMYLGVHTLLDVTVGLLLGVVFVIPCFMAYDKIKNDLAVSIILSIISICVGVYAIIIMKNGYVTFKLVSDCCKASASGLAFAISWYVERKYINFSVKTSGIGTQIIKLAIGVTIALVIKSGLKLLFGDNVYSDFIRYFFTSLWILMFYPLVFTFFNRKKTLL